jgi:hypothetical protein
MPKFTSEEVREVANELVTSHYDGLTTPAEDKANAMLTQFAELLEAVKWLNDQPLVRPYFFYLREHKDRSPQYSDLDQDGRRHAETLFKAAGLE